MRLDRLRTLTTLRASAPTICPAILQSNYAFLDKEVDDIERAGSAVVHWDVMDGHFVPNLSYGAMVIASLRSRSTLIFDAHLMISDPAKYLDDFFKAGCDNITIHLEATPNPRDLLRAIRAGGATAGLAINPPTPVQSVERWWGEFDILLCMSVMPGFGGQTFDERAIEKLRWARDNGPEELLLEVDGGIHSTTVGTAAQAGAQMLVTGSAFSGADDRREVYRVLSSLAREASTPSNAEPTRPKSSRSIGAAPGLNET